MPDLAVQSKACTKCRKVKSLDEFYNRTKSADGKEYQCKVCSESQKADYRKRNRAKVRAYDRKRREKNRERIRQQYRDFYQRNKDRVHEDNRQRNSTPEGKIKRAARAKIGDRVRRGMIVKPPNCSRCGNDAPLDAHHPDYSKPLEVEWVCELCHGRIHNEIKDEPCATA